MTKTNLYKNDFNIVHPGATLAETLECLNMSQSELAKRILRPEKTISEIINGVAMITPDTAIQFERALGIPASFWNNLEKNYQEALAKARARLELKKEIPNLAKFPYSEMIKLGWIKATRDVIERIENLLLFFGVSTLSSIQVTQEIAFRKAKSVNFSPESLATWIRKGEIDASKTETEDFNKEGLLKSLYELRGLTRKNISEASSIAQKICAQNGVALVFIPYITKSNVKGAARWLSPNKATIQLSLRGRFNDIFWFTFFHELGHILLEGKREKFIDMEKKDDTQEEINADSFACEQLIPKVELKNYLENNLVDADSITKFANDIGVHPGIVVGRLQHENLLNYKSNLNALKEKYSCN